MQLFEERYNRLNDEQKEAVNTIFDHLLVVAGPGSGKTELLSVRIANILKETDTLPQNILCLTFTEAAASNMRARLQGLIGEAAFHVGIHTFHSFGSQIFSQYPEYLEGNVKLKAADEEDKYRIMEDVFSALSKDNPLAVWNEYSGYYFIDSALKAISNLRRQGITPDILGQIIESNSSFLQRANSLVSEVFSERLSKSSILAAAQLANKLASLDGGDYPQFIRPIQAVLVESLSIAAELSADEGKTAHLSEWKRKYTEKVDGEVALKSISRTDKLYGLQEVYAAYLEGLKKEQVFDFDDMIIEAAEAIRGNASLRSDLQERYQFVLVDEYQDTSGAQLSLLTAFIDPSLTNVMAVGDDDQSIFAFQGAEIANILSFNELFPNAKHVILKHNYRSHSSITDTFSGVAEHIPERLSDIAHFEKIVTASGGHAAGKVERLLVKDALQQYTAVLNELSSVDTAASVAIIAKKHDDLLRMAHVLKESGIDFSYDRQEDVLDSEIVQYILAALRFAAAATDGRARSIDAELVKLLSAPHFAEAGLFVHDWTVLRRRMMAEGKWTSALSYFEHEDKYKELSRYLNTLISIYSTAPAVRFLEHLFSSKEPLSLRGSFFTDMNAESHVHSSMYREVMLLASAQPTSPERLLAKLERMSLWNIRVSAKDSDARISLISAHGSKGLEFDHVFVLSATEGLWFSRGGSLNISSHENIPLERKSTRADALRLLFVAASRAKYGLHFIEPQQYEGKDQHPITALQDIEGREIPEMQIDVPELLHASFSPKEEELIDAQLENFVLSPSHLSMYLDIARSGPRAFLERSIYRFPDERSESLMVGQAIHGTLEYAFKEGIHAKSPILEETLHTLLLGEGVYGDRIDVLIPELTELVDTYLSHHEQDLSGEHLLEYSLRPERLFIGEVPASGIIDRLAIDPQEKKLKIVDYKYTKVTPTWKTKADKQQIKQYSYRLQLLFYVQLLKRSAKFSDYTIDSPELHLLKNEIGKHILPLAYSTDDLEHHGKLVEAVYAAIMDKYFPDVEQAETIDDILRFEQTILERYA
jgi:DNA helicase-2/ATP-dependent DNA helicase PcrA